MIAVEAHYYLDDELISAYKPSSSWNNDEMHLMHLLYFIESLEGGKNYKFEIRLLMTKGSAYLGVEKIHANLRGQGLVAVESWDGYLELEDEYSLIGEGSATFGYTDSLSLTWHDVISLDISDNYSLVGEGSAVFGYTDITPVINIFRPIYTRITDDDDVRITDDGDVRITDGGEPT